MDNLKQAVGVGADSGHALREALMAVRKGGRVSVPGVYGGFMDKFPLGALMQKGLQLRTGQTHVQAYTHDLLRRIQEGELDTTFMISHRLPLEEAAKGYEGSAGTRTTGPRSCSRPDACCGRRQALPDRNRVPGSSCPLPGRPDPGTVVSRRPCPMPPCPGIRVTCSTEWTMPMLPLLRSLALVFLVAMSLGPAAAQDATFETSV